MNWLIKFSNRVGTNIQPFKDGPISLSDALISFFIFALASLIIKEILNNCCNVSAQHINCDNNVIQFSPNGDNSCGNSTMTSLDVQIAVGIWTTLIV